jgi:polyhydroxyalkanoate synthesis regulator phasin
MANKDGFQKYLDAGIAFTALTRARAEELVHELVQSGEFQSDDARAKVEELIGMARKGREVLVAQVRHEVARQMDSAGVTNLEDLAKQVASLIGRTAEAGRAATGNDKAKKPAPKGKASGKAGATKGSATSATKTAATKKKAATKAAAKKSPARKAAGTKAAGTKAAGTKTAGTKTAAKKTTAKRSPSADRPVG